MNESLSFTLKTLRLSGLAETLDVRLQEASGNHLTHAEFLELILQDELSSAARNGNIATSRKPLMLLAVGCTGAPSAVFSTGLLRRSLSHDCYPT